MFPTTHDITPEVLDPCLTVLDTLVKTGNSILIVTKPHYECVTALCRLLADSKPQILFRFTIGGMDDDIREYWEPGAPAFRERLKCLKYAFKHGFNTSVSAEPMLEPWDVHKLVRRVAPYVTDSIWLGKLNEMDRRVEIRTREDRRMVARLAEGQSDENIHAIYESLRNYPKMKWKESIKKVVGLEVATEAGLDE
jgi:DNA repair photolyase